MKKVDMKKRANQPQNTRRKSLLWKKSVARNWEEHRSIRTSRWEACWIGRIIDMTLADMDANIHGMALRPGWPGLAVAES
jgi:hypothetical protein